MLQLAANRNEECLPSIGFEAKVRVVARRIQGQTRLVFLDILRKITMVVVFLWISRKAGNFFNIKLH